MDKGDISGNLRTVWCVLATPYLVILFMCTQCIVYSECQTDVDGATALPATGTTKCYQDSNAKAKVPPN